jgi:hypothetical protein
MQKVFPMQKVFSVQKVFSIVSAQLAAVHHLLCFVDGVINLFFEGLHLYTSAYVSTRQHTSAYVGIRQHTSAYVSIRQHTSAYASSTSFLKASI